jgi:hypothetical protein
MTIKDRPYGNGFTGLIQVRARPDLQESLERIAREKESSVSGVARQILTEYGNLQTEKPPSVS